MTLDRHNWNSLWFFESLQNLLYYFPTYQLSPTGTNQSLFFPNFPKCVNYTKNILWICILSFQSFECSQNHIQLTCLRRPASTETSRFHNLSCFTVSYGIPGFSFSFHYPRWAIHKLFFSFLELFFLQIRPCFCLQFHYLCTVMSNSFQWFTKQKLSWIMSWSCLQLQLLWVY